MDDEDAADGDTRAGSLTPAEREVLQHAVSRGYFAVPRETSLADIAAELGRSDVEVSRLLRRGTATILRDAEVLDE